MNITTRFATLEDIETLKQFEQALIQIERPMDDTLKQQEPINYYDLEALITSENADILLALDDEHIIGCGYGAEKTHDDKFQEERYGYVGFIYVQDSYRGKGVGQVILTGLKHWFKQRNLTEIRLKVYASNAKAIKAYEAAGFSAHLLEMKMHL